MVWKCVVCVCVWLKGVWCGLCGLGRVWFWACGLGGRGAVWEVCRLGGVWFGSVWFVGVLFGGVCVV